MIAQCLSSLNFATLSNLDDLRMIPFPVFHDYVRDNEILYRWRRTYSIGFIHIPGAKFFGSISIGDSQSCEYADLESESIVLLITSRESST